MKNGALRPCCLHFDMKKDAETATEDIHYSFFILHSRVCGMQP
jgi:hypothetical protein